MDAIGNDVVAEWAGLAVRYTPANTAARHPHTEASRMVIAAIIGGRQSSLRIICPSELAAPDHQRVLQHATLPQIFQEGRAGLVGFFALDFHAAGNVAVMIPTLMVELDEPNAAFCQTTSEYAICSKRSWLGRVWSVEIEDVLGLVGNVRNFRNTRLHSIGHFVLTDPGCQIRIA